MIVSTAYECICIMIFNPCSINQLDESNTFSGWSESNLQPQTLNTISSVWKMNIITNNYHGTAIDNRYSVRPAFNHQCCMSTCSGIHQDNFYNGQFGHVNKKSGGSCQHFHFLENRSPASATIVTSLATVTRRQDGTASGLGKQETKNCA